MEHRTLIALLRGINVGGHRKVPMADLRGLAADLGFEDVGTYVQSGNLVFAAAQDETRVVTRLEDAILERFGFEVPVIVRTADAWSPIAAAHPLSPYESDPRRLMVAFLDAVPSVAVVDVLDAAEFEPDRFVAGRREVYLAYPNGIGRSRLSHAVLEKRLGVRATIRNWNTVAKLAEMAGRAGA